MQEHVEKLTITLPAEVYNRIELESKAKDMTRSRYVLRLLEKAYSVEGKEQ